MGNLIFCILLAVFIRSLSYCKGDYNYGHIIMRIFAALPNFLFTTSETKPDY